MNKKYNLSRICYLMKLPEHIVQKQEIDRLDYLVNNIDVLDEPCFDDSPLVVSHKTCGIIHNPSQIYGTKLHVNEYKDEKSIDLKSCVKNHTIEIDNSHLI